jgi:cobalt-zinc-cadmium resistance protein CzcA
MTTLVAMIGLFPAAVSNGIGSQTQKPLAIVVIGGSAMLAVVARMIQPPLIVLAHGWVERLRSRLGGGASGGGTSFAPPPVTQ